MKKFIAIMVIVIALVGVLSKVAPDNQYVAPVQSIEPKVEQDPILLQDLKLLGAKYADKLNLRYTDGFKDPNTSGLYSNWDTITIKANLDKKREHRVIAHEYLHYIWYKVLDDNQRTDITNITNTLYSNDPAMAKRMSFYSNPKPNELFSIYCTESTDQYITPLIMYCNSYINRSVLTFLR
jgi:hypothetical protein